MATKDLFNNASLRLTSLYLVLIMCISLLFTFAIYRISSDELQRTLKRPISQQERRILISKRDIDAVIEQRQEELGAAETRLRSGLVFLNVGIIIVGGGISYILARRTLRPIEQAHEAQSRFTADASHELRTPITAMRIETELTLTEPKLTLKQAKKQLESNIEELDKLTALSEGLLQLARLTDKELEKTVVDAELLIQKAVARVQKKAESKKQIILTKNISKIKLHVNEAAMVEALVTILDNACKYSPENSEITIEAKSIQNSIQLSIQDQGIGIKELDKKRIFDRFYRADNSRTASGDHGYGIGLSIAQAVVDAHRGSISVKSSPNKGAAFTITIPR